MVANLTVVLFFLFFFIHTKQKQKSLPQMGGSIAEPQTTKIYKTQGITKIVRGNIGENTDD